MKRIQLPNYPTDLPNDKEVRDFELDDGRFARVIMELENRNVSLNPAVNNVEHFVMTAQAYEMTADGNFVTAPLGYPSRSGKSEHSVSASALGDMVEMDDAWVRIAMPFNPDEPGSVVTVQGKPIEPGKLYGETVWDETTQRLFQWKEGFADSTARAKVEDLRTILNTSRVRSGMAFKR